MHWAGRLEREQLERLFAELPDLTWILVGDDGQHDPQVYAEAAGEHPDKVAAPHGSGLRDALRECGVLGA